MQSDKVKDSVEIVQAPENMEVKSLRSTSQNQVKQPSRSLADSEELNDMEKFLTGSSKSESSDSQDEKSNDELKQQLQIMIVGEESRNTQKLSVVDEFDQIDKRISGFVYEAGSPKTPGSDTRQNFGQDSNLGTEIANMNKIRLALTTQGAAESDQNEQLLNSQNESSQRNIEDEVHLNLQDLGVSSRTQNFQKFTRKKKKQKKKGIDRPVGFPDSSKNKAYAGPDKSSSLRQGASKNTGALKKGTTSIHVSKLYEKTDNQQLDKSGAQTSKSVAFGDETNSLSKLGKIRQDIVHRQTESQRNNISGHDIHSGSDDCFENATLTIMNKNSKSQPIAQDDSNISLHNEKKESKSSQKKAEAFQKSNEKQNKIDRLILAPNQIMVIDDNVKSVRGNSQLSHRRRSSVQSANSNQMPASNKQKLENQRKQTQKNGSGKNQHEDKQAREIMGQLSQIKTSDNLTSINVNCQIMNTTAVDAGFIPSTALLPQEQLMKESGIQNNDLTNEEKQYMSLHHADPTDVLLADGGDTTRLNGGQSNVLEEKLIQNLVTTTPTKTRKSIALKRKTIVDPLDITKKGKQYKVLKNKQTLRESSIQNKLNDMVDQNMKQRQPSMTASDLQKKLEKTLTKNHRSKQMNNLVDKLQKEHIGYFNGKKVPFVKNQSYKQCIYNPYSDVDGVITVQVVGQLISADFNPFFQAPIDKLTEKVQFHLENSKNLYVSKFKTDKDLFEQSGSSNFHEYGKIFESKNQKLKRKDKDYAVISYWRKQQDGKYHVLMPQKIPMALSRLVNADADLHETVFKSENLNLMFIFSIIADKNHKMVINLLGKPELDFKTRETQINKMNTKKNTKVSKLSQYKSIKKGEVENFFNFSGIKQVEIQQESLLEQQIKAYLLNKKSLDHEKNGKQSYPMRSPTIFRLQNEGLLVLTKTIDTSQKPSIFFFNVIDQHKLGDGTAKSDHSIENQDFDSFQLTGNDPAFEIAGAEMFLCIKDSNIYYLTNKKLANPDHPCKDPIEARFSSPSQVKMITEDQMERLKNLTDKAEIALLMAEVKTWDMSGDQQTIDYFRCYSIEYPYVEGFLHDDNTRITLLFSGLELLCSVSLTFTLTEADQTQKPNLGELDPNQEFLEGNYTLQYQEEDESKELEMSAQVQNKNDLCIIVKGSSEGKELFIDYEAEFETWESVKFNHHNPNNPVKLSQVFLDKSTHPRIQKIKASISGVSDGNITMNSAVGFKTQEEFDPDGYPGEKSFSLECNPDDVNLKLASVSIKGYCKISPFGSKIYMIYEAVDEDVVTKRIIFDKRTQATLQIRDPDYEDKDSDGDSDRDSDEDSDGSLQNDDKALQSFEVEAFRGTVKDKGLLSLKPKQQQNDISVMHEFAHKLVRLQTQEDTLYVLKGSLKEMSEKFSEPENEQDFLQLISLNKIQQQPADQDSLSNENDNQDQDDNQLMIPAKEIVDRIFRGGEIKNENGLVYTIKVKSQNQVLINTVGYEFAGGTPNVNFFMFDLEKVQEDEMGEKKERLPLIQSPITQHFIIDYPIVAYKSFMSDNSEIVLNNVAQRKQPQQILDMGDWMFICFVDRANMQELTSGENLMSRILFIAFHKTLKKNRLFMIKKNPWFSTQPVDDYKQEVFGFVECFQTGPFEIPEQQISQLKKVSLLIGDDMEKQNQMMLIFQFEETLWSVPLFEQGVTKQILPTKEFSMIKRPIIRNKIMESSIFCGAQNPESASHSLLRISIDQSKAGEIKVETAYTIQNARIVGFEIDPEYQGNLYCLDEESKLVHLYDPFYGKLLVNHSYDLSLIHSLEETIEDFMFNHQWDSIHIDNRTITIHDQTYSLVTNFSYSIIINEDLKRSQYRKSVGYRSKRLLTSQPIPGTLLILQVWKADEIFYFRVKPCPGSSIIDVLGQARTNYDCKMYFANDDHVLINVANKQALTFDREGYIIKNDFPLYAKKHKIKAESTFFNNNKFFVIRDMSDKNHSIIREEKMNPEDVEDGQKSHQTQVMQDPFNLDDLEQDLKNMNTKNLGLLFSQKGPHIIDYDIAESIVLHKEHLILTKYGTLFLIASCVLNSLEDHHSIFYDFIDGHGNAHTKKTKEDFVYDKSQNLFGFYNYGLINIIFVVCRSKSEQSQLSSKIEVEDENELIDPLKDSVKSAKSGEYSKYKRIATSLTKQDSSEDTNMLRNFQFQIIEHKLIWVNFEQKKIWELDTSQIKGQFSNTKTEVNVEQSGHEIDWYFFECKSFSANSIFFGITPEEFDKRGVGIHEVSESSMIRKRKITEEHDEWMELVQFTLKNDSVHNAIVLNLTSIKPYIIDQMKEIDQFQYPLYFSSSGFSFLSKHQTMCINSDQSMGFKRPFMSQQSRGLYRSFAEIDLKQIVKLCNIITTIFQAKKTLKKSDIGEIEPLTASCVFNQETFFSIFAEQGIIYEVFYDQIRLQEQANERQMLQQDEFDLFMRRLRLVITRPTPIYGKKNEPQITTLSILKQCVLFTDQKSRVSMYRMADLFDLDLTDYISCTADLRLVIKYLPSAQYFKMFDKFQQNIYTMQIKEAVMPKKVNLKTFRSETSVVTQDHESFGLSKDIKDDEALRKVQVKVIPLNWVYVNGKSLSTLFREFRVFQEQFQGSELLDVMFDSFWSDFKWKIFTLCFMPYLIYFTSAFLYMTNMLYETGEEAENFNFSADTIAHIDQLEPPLRYIFTVLLLFHFGIQIKQMVNDGFKSHITQTQNLVDVISYLLNLALLTLRFSNIANIYQTRLLGSVAGFFLWVQLIFWLRLFDSTAHFVSLVVRTISSISNFMIVMSMIMLGSGTAFYILQLNRIYRGAEADDLIFDFQPDDYLYYMAILNQYFIVLGDFENMSLSYGENAWGEALVTIGFIMTTFLSQITILNLLIAIMSETFSQHMSEQEVKSKQQKLLLLSEYIEIIEFYLNKCCKCLKKRNPMFVFVITTITDDADPDNDFDDNDNDESQKQILAVKRTVEQKFDSLEALMNKKMVKGLTQLGSDTRARLTAMQAETKNKLQHVMAMIIKDTTEKQKVQKLQIEDIKEFISKEIFTKMNKHTNNILQSIKKQDVVIQQISNSTTKPGYRV